MPDSSVMPRRETLDERVERLRVKPRTCRDCPLFAPDASGLGFGWCSAHHQHVKLAQGTAPFFSQCQFKTLTRLAPHERLPDARS